jgi:uncharacterized protein
VIDDMHDPREGVTPDGLIRTGVAREVIGSTWTPVLQAAIDAVAGRASLYVYGSVATGCAVVSRSDVDLLSIGLPPPEAERISLDLSARFSDVCREVSVAPAAWAGLKADDDEGYGLRVFLRHYCAHLAGDDPAHDMPAFPADKRAARGFNGDIALHLQRWQIGANDDADVAHLATRIARKTLLAVAGLVSIRDGTWTTDRRTSAWRWRQIERDVPVEALVDWLDAPPRHLTAVHRVLDGPVADVVGLFSLEIGLWDP